MENASPCVALAACPSLLDLEIVGLYHYNVADASLAQHVEKGMADGLPISCVASCFSLWALLMDAGTRFTSQVYELSPSFLRKEWIMDQWEKSYYISSIAGSTCGSSLVVMFKVETGFMSPLWQLLEAGVVLLCLAMQVSVTRF
ncbi:hypothetical protein CCACVL1_14176 [Corchorus capsularis]|uniref:DUF7477 domain-containing protein n=1 Tax=Corchorus capsularis TaxID=210143 RepID=A0A1R3I807_COCAP|nr:hypothetical protein CCACVL1_14176 [Corchorus capsularis]